MGTQKINKYQERCDFFGNYIGQDVRLSGRFSRILMSGVTTETVYLHPFVKDTYRSSWAHISNCRLLLIPLKLIGINHFNHCMKILNIKCPLFYEKEYEPLKTNFINLFSKKNQSKIKCDNLQFLEVYQFLQKEGYAVLWRNYTVEELVRKGWIIYLDEKAEKEAWDKYYKEEFC